MSNITNKQSSSSSNIDNSSGIPDILEQIKKKSEEISTSDASIKLLQNLSNPTNLTNPQIITSLSHNKNNISIRKNIDVLPSIKHEKLIFSNDNIKKFPRKSKSDIMSINVNQFSTIDPFNLNNYHKLIRKAELDLLISRKQNQRRKINFEIIGKKIMNYRENFLSRNYRNILSPNAILYDDLHSERNEKENIWEKLKKVNLMPIDRRKDKKTNIIRFIPKKEFIEKTNLIKLFDFNNKTKNERYNQYLSLKKSNMKSTDDTLNRLKNSKDFLEKRYKKDYVAYIHFLANELEKEKVLNINILNEKNEKLNIVNKLMKKIEKINYKKINLIKWLYLQIQVKEKKPQLPEYYKFILEDGISVDEINRKGKGKYTINNNEYYRIMNYKGKNLYEDANEFFKQIDDLEIRSLTKLNTKLDLLDEDYKLKEEFNELKKQDMIMSKEENDKFQKLMYDLKNAKKTNAKLKNELSILKKVKIRRRPNDKILIKKLATYAQQNSDIEGMNFILKNDKSMIYYLVVCLYHIISLANFEEIKNKNLNIDINKIDDKNVLEVLVYAEKVLNLLLFQKKNYYSNKNLKIIYEQVKDGIDKKTKLEKMLVQIKMQKQREIEKKEKLKEKINKKYYKPKRKIDYDYYRKEIHIKNQTILNKSVKNETKFEDFLYDIYS